MGRALLRAPVLSCTSKVLESKLTSNNLTFATGLPKIRRPYKWKRVRQQRKPESLVLLRQFTFRNYVMCMSRLCSVVQLVGIILAVMLPRVEYAASFIEIHACILSTVQQSLSDLDLTTSNPCVSVAAMTNYVPEVGHRVRITLVGTVSDKYNALGGTPIMHIDAKHSLLLNDSVSVEKCAEVGDVITTHEALSLLPIKTVVLHATHPESHSPLRKSSAGWYAANSASEPIATYLLNLPVQILWLPEKDN